MNDPKPIASLSPTLLARKGGARPAMRPQLQAMPHYQDATAHDVHSDLGWNDMGHDSEDHESRGHETGDVEVQHEAEIVSLVPAAANGVASVPEVVRQQETIASRVAAPVKLARPRRSALDDGRRAAFTLRLDADRHLKLRLACTIRNRSAQQLVIDALDQLIDALPDLESLAANVASRR